MSYDIEPPGRRIPTLVQYCQRVACTHVENIVSIGEGWRYDLIRPVLESCTPDTLRRFEEADPYIANDTTDIWKALFLKEFPIEAHRYESNAMEEPESWRDELFAVRDRERQRFHQLSVKLKASRQEEEDRKRESAIKLTDRVPQAKRARTWGAPSQSKTLFQKTKSDTARLQKGVFGTRYTRPSFQTQRIVPNSVSAKPPPPSSSASTSSTVVVRTVHVTPKPPQPQPSPKVQTKPTRTMSSNTPSTPARRLAPSPPPPSSPPAPPSPPNSHSPPPRVPPKKNAASSLFMPKHRAYSQVPRGVQSKS
ncbi:RNA polymerase II transcription factor SIII subunit A-domain-containing protein [Cerioporus squamosus]|nr:RNA polymerase II transcription factor SIII subunit A-domain-containing protein [Cerioporus squamosus]